MNVNDRFLECCDKGDFIRAIRLLTMDRCNLNLGFRLACAKGHFDIVRYLCELHTTTKYQLIDIHFNKEFCFRSACEHGYLDIVRYLCELYKKCPRYTKINIHVKYEDGFISACKNRRYDIIQYLGELYKHDSNYKIINISSHFNFLTFMACYRGDYKLIRYLCKLYNKYPDYILHKKDAASDWIYNYIHIISDKQSKIVIYLLRLYRNHNYEPIKCYTKVFRKPYL